MKRYLILLLLGLTVGSAYALQLQTWDPKYPIGRYSSYFLDYNSKKEALMLYGGRTYFGWLNWLWEWSGTEWQRLNIRGAIGADQVTYDTARQVYIAYGQHRECNIFELPSARLEVTSTILPKSWENY